MRRQTWVILAGVLTLAISGCASEEAPPAATSPSPSPAAASPAPAPVAAAPANAPTVAQQPANTQAEPPVSAGLIASTNTQERQKQIASEMKSGSDRSDPFAGLPPAPPTPTATKQKAVPNVARLPGSAGGGAGGAGATNASDKKDEVPTPSIPKNQDAPLGFSIPPIRPPQSIAAGPGSTTGGGTTTITLPPKPTANTAAAVEVTGVAVVGNSAQAIVVAPGDATSRYVSPGQRISGGKVLVKRIEMKQGMEPVVILEENGIEVAKTVGEKPAQASKPNA